MKDTKKCLSADDINDLHGQADEKDGYLNPAKTRYTTYTWVYQW